MKKLLASILILLLLVPKYSSAGEPSDEQQRINGIERAINATVKITITTSEYIAMPLSTGSGFFIATNTVLTNAHVVMKPGITAIKVTISDGTECTGKLGYRDEANDLAMVTTDCTGETLTIADYATVGQDAYIIGSSTVDFAVTEGIVSKLSEKSHLLVNIYAAHGDSGGAIVGSDGKVIGVVRSGEAPFIYGIPIKYIKAFLERAGE